MSYDSQESHRMICCPFPLHFHPPLTALTVLLTLTEVPSCIIVCLFFPLLFPAFLYPLWPTSWPWRPDNLSSLPQYPSHYEDNMRWLTDKRHYKDLFLFFVALVECCLHVLDVRSLKTMHHGDKHRHYSALSGNVQQNCFESSFHNYTPEVTSWTCRCLAAAHKRKTVGSSTSSRKILQN